MKIMTWNVRGANHPNFVYQVRKLLTNLTPNILFLSEIKVNVNKN